MMNIDADFIQTQKEYLEDLISFKAHPLELDSRDKLAWQDWDYGRLAYVTRKDAISVLKRVKAGVLTLKDYYEWGLSITGRSTIGYEKGFQKILSSVVDDIIPAYDARHMSPIPEDFVDYYLNELENAQFDTTEEDDDEDE